MVKHMEGAVSWRRYFEKPRSGREATPTLNSVSTLQTGFSAHSQRTGAGETHSIPQLSHSGTDTRRQNRHVLGNALHNVSEKSIRMLESYYVVWKGKLYHGMCKRIPFLFRKTYIFYWLLVCHLQPPPPPEYKFLRPKIPNHTDHSKCA